MQRGILPKGADLPSLDLNAKFDEEKIKENAKLKVDRKGQSYSQPLVRIFLCRKKRIKNKGKRI